MSLPFPAAVPLRLDDRARRRGRLLAGGDPPRLMRLSASGQEALARLLADGARSDAERRLARRLVDAGIAHPTPPPVALASPSEASEVTIAIPVRDRPAELERCLAACAGSAPIVVVDDGSVDGNAIAAICASHGARVLRRGRSGGPAAARNTALAAISTPLTALLDSDCVPPPCWLGPLLAHFADPLVAAVAPRISAAPEPGRRSALRRYAAARSPLDLGPAPARVRPGGRVSYVPTAALVVRTAALAGGFDPRLRYGEDVDLVWRLDGAGQRVRYEPAVTVAHREPTRLADLLRRRFHYGTAAAPLEARHPGRLAPLVLAPAPTAVVLLALARRPRAAALALAAATASLMRTGMPFDLALRHTTDASARTFTATGTAATMLAGPALLTAIAAHRTRRPAIALALAGPLARWWPHRRRLDPVRFAALNVLDDVAYGAGVWAGALRQRRPRALLPRLLPARQRRRRAERTP